MNIQIETKTALDSKIWIKYDTEIILGSMEAYIELKGVYDLDTFTMSYEIDDDKFKEIITGIVILTEKELCGLYSRLVWEVGAHVEYKYLLTSAVSLKNYKCACMIMGNKLGKLPFIAQATTLYTKSVEVVKDIVEERILCSRQADRSDPLTYYDNTAQYVAEAYERRVSDLLKIVRPFVNSFNIRSLLALHDGAGVMYAVGKLLGVPCISYDSSLSMIQEAKLKGNDVRMSDGQEFFNPGVVVISHSETLDPGLVLHCISLGRSLIVFESSQYYLGSSRLYYCHPSVRSTYDLKLPIMLSGVPKYYPTSAWYKIIKNGTNFYVSDHLCLKHLQHLKVLGIPFSISTSNILVLEKVQEFGFSCHVYQENDIGVYYNSVDRVCKLYFSLREGRFHFPFRDVEKGEVFQYILNYPANISYTFAEKIYGRLLKSEKIECDVWHRVSGQPILPTCDLSLLYYNPVSQLYKLGTVIFGVEGQQCLVQGVNINESLIKLLPKLKPKEIYGRVPSLSQFDAYRNKEVCQLRNMGYELRSKYMNTLLSNYISSWTQQLKKVVRPNVYAKAIKFDNKPKIKYKGQIKVKVGHLSCVGEDT